MEAPVGILCNAAAIGSRPVAAVRGARNPCETIARDAFGVALVVYGKADPVESNKAVERRQPQIAFRSLTEPGGTTHTTERENLGAAER